MRNVCNNCIYNNRDTAKAMFQKQYCDLKECTADGKGYCKYKKRDKEFLLFRVIKSFFKMFY